MSMYVIGPIKIPKKFGLSSSIIALSAKPSSREAMENVFGFHGQEGCSKVPPPQKKIPREFRSWVPVMGQMDFSCDQLNQ